MHPLDRPLILTAAHTDAVELAYLRRDRQRADRRLRELRQAEAARAATAQATAARAERAARAAQQTGRVARTKTRIPIQRTRHTRSLGGLPAFVAPADGSRVAIVIAFALAQVGKRYVWGTAGPSTYDCSGLVMRAYAQVGIRLPHQSGGIAAEGRSVPRGHWQPGDVLIWSGHVALYIGAGQMVEAANSRVPVRRVAVRGSPGARRFL